MGQRERKHFAPATAAPARAADVGLVQNTPGRGEKGQIHPSGKHQGIQGQDQEQSSVSWSCQELLHKATPAS